MTHPTLLAGAWQGKGVMRGAPMKAEYRWERDLGRKFVRLRYRVLAAGKMAGERLVGRGMGGGIAAGRGQ